TAYRQERRDLGIVSEKEISQQYRKRLSKKAHFTSTSPKSWDVSGSITSGDQDYEMLKLTQLGCSKAFWTASFFNSTAPG
ncbi:hypothetical protein B4N84_12815, partial [Flavobacterium sp. IR1]